MITLRLCLCVCFCTFWMPVWRPKRTLLGWGESRGAVAEYIKRVLRKMGIRYTYAHTMMYYPIKSIFLSFFFILFWQMIEITELCSFRFIKFLVCARCHWGTRFKVEARMFYAQKLCCCRLPFYCCCCFCYCCLWLPINFIWIVFKSKTKCSSWNRLMR